MSHIAAIFIGFLLDAWWGDPLWLWHPVCAIGNLITALERKLRHPDRQTPRMQRIAGMLLWLLVCITAYLVPWLVLYLAGHVHKGVAFVIETLMCYQIFARNALQRESVRVYQTLQRGDLAEARQAVSYIVGRDTQALSTQGVTKATVETVAENTSDGVIAPMLFLFLGGAPLGFLYKAVNTLDSMVGYRNERYLHFGWFSAKVDDVCNWIPARFSALCMMVAAGLLRLDGKGAWRIWRRDRRKHASPNAAQTESVCAGALGIALAGGAYYFGQYYEKPVIGDAVRDITAQDILQTNRMMHVASWLALLLLGMFFWLIRSKMG